MASQGACFNVTTTAISGSGTITTGSFVSGSILYKYYKFEGTTGGDDFTASLNILSGSTGQAKLLLVGGGGTGADQTSFINGGTTYDVEAAGGGGGGGVVYYNQIPISSGSYLIQVAGEQRNLSTNGRGNNGKNTTFKLVNNFSYPAFNSNILTAYGGGGGGKAGIYHRLSPSAYFSYTYSPTAGGSGGGGGQAYIGGGTSGGSAGAGTLSPNGLYNNPQGNVGGNAESNYPNAAVSTAGGGGGAGASGSSAIIPISSPADAARPGGSALSFNIINTAWTLAGGGGGASYNTVGANGGGNYGAGGDGFNKNGTNSNPYGGYGLALIVIPVCSLDTYNCTQYKIAGGATGGTITYIPCGSNNKLVSASIDFGYTGSVCTYVAGGYPTSTGTVTLTASGSCNQPNPIPINITCPSGSVKTPVYTYNYSLPGQCYPTPSSCQRTYYPQQIINYVDVNNVSQSIVVGSSFTGTGTICAKTTPTPTISAGTITYSGLICAYYCSSSV